MNCYLDTKARLFKSTKFSVLNKDDKSFFKIKKITRAKVITYGLKHGDYNLEKFPFKTKLPGDFNKSNCLAAIAAVKVLKVKNKIIRQAVANFKGVAGRMEEIKNGQKFRVFVDFAHTPNALKNALKTLKSFNHGNLIAVFGCAGLRDRKKRPMMGRVACQLADKVILTAEDPRTEDLDQIIDKIAAGCKNKKKILKEPDRQKAIDLAINLAKKGDIVGIFGKGHEQSLCFGITEYPWSDHKAVKKALKRRLN